MDSVYIKKDYLNKWVAKYFKNKDIISIDDLIECIEDLDGKVEELEDEITNLKEEHYEDDYEDRKLGLKWR